MKTIKQHIRKLDKNQFSLLLVMCKHSNSLYNCSLYVIKTYYKETGKYIGYAKLYEELKSNQHYKFLPAKISQQTLRMADKNYRSFFSLLKKKQHGQYGEIIREPKYKKSNSLWNLILPNDQVNLIKNHLKITKDIRIPFNYQVNGVIKQVVIKPRKEGKYYEIYITYQENKVDEAVDLNSNNYLSIDVGVKNFAACFSNVGHSFIVNGNPIKSVNQFYNKRKSNIQSQLKKCNNNKKWSNSLSTLSINRDNYINNYFNQSVNIIKKYCLANKIKTVIVGYNEGWKQKINLGKKMNQKFSYIPYYKFKTKLENKLKEFGIDVFLQEEAYTSKCSFLDNEIVKKHDIYLGKRIKRGLFKTNNGTLINADINGAANIMKKVVSNVGPKDLTNEIVGGIVRPLVLKNIFSTQKDKR